jgi:anaerobic selenocysteine-containing dehydrogenase
MTVEQIHTYCAMCISRCGVVATVDDGVLTKVNADPEHPNGCICVKGTAAPEIVYSRDRLQYPMIRTRSKGETNPGWARISWDDAMNLIASRFLDLKAKHGPEAVVFGFGTPSGGATSDSARWVERLANAFGSPNLMAATHICNWNREWGSRYSYGVATPPPDYQHSRCILMWGFNPYVSWPAAAMRVTQAKGRGAKIIVIDPRKSTVVEKADLWLQVRPGADDTLALAMIHVLIDEKLYDESFIREWTNAPFLVRDDTQQLLTGRDISQMGDPESFFVWDSGRQLLVAYGVDRGYAANGVMPALTGTHAIALNGGKVVECRPAFQELTELVARFAPESSEELTGVPARQVRDAVRIFTSAKPSCYYSWAGLEQHANAAQMNRAVCIFYALTGQFDQRGSNVIFSTTATRPITGDELLSPEAAARRLGYADRPLGPAVVSKRVQAYDVYRAILTGEPYPVKGLITFGSDPLLGNGDTLRGKAALEAIDFYVHVDMFANPSAAFADLLLPASTCWEREGLMLSFPTAEETINWVQLRPSAVAPQHESRSDLRIIFDLAERMGLGEHFFGGDIDTAYDYQLAPSGLTVEQLRKQPIGMRAELRTRYRKYAKIDAQTGRPHGFHTPTRKLEIYSTSFAKAGYPPLPAPAESSFSGADLSQKYPLVLTFSRLMQFCDQQHRNIPRLRRQAREPFLEIHPHTAAPLKIQNEEWVVLETANSAARFKAKFNSLLHPTVVTTQYGWWQSCETLGLPGYDPFGPSGSNANLLIANDIIDPISGSVPHRSHRCRIKKANEVA